MKKFVILIAILALVTSCAGMPTVKWTTDKEADNKITPVEIKKYRVENDKQSAEDLLAELKALYGPPIMHSRSFTIFINEEPVSVKMRNYYFEISETHYTVVTTYNGVVQNHDTIEKYRVK